MSALDLAPVAPSALPLDPGARLFMLTTLQAAAIIAGPKAVESWREAYGRAADYQTVVAARTVLAASERVAS